MSVVYFIQTGADGPIKIGFTTDLARRVKHLQAGCPDLLAVLATIKAEREYETRLHWALAPYRHRGEWFSPTGAVLEAVEAAKEGREYSPPSVSHAMEITGAQRLLADIEHFCEEFGIPESSFGRKAVNDWKFVGELRCGRGGKPRRIWPETEAQVRKFMVTYHTPNQVQVAAA